MTTFSACINAEGSIELIVWTLHSLRFFEALIKLSLFADRTNNAVFMNTALFVLSANNDNLIKASKNLRECKVQTINSIDPSALIQAEKVVITSETLNKLTEVLA